MVLGIDSLCHVVYYARRRFAEWNLDEGRMLAAKTLLCCQPWRLPGAGYVLQYDPAFWLAAITVYGCRVLGVLNANLL